MNNIRHNGSTSSQTNAKTCSIQQNVALASRDTGSAAIHCVIHIEFLYGQRPTFLRLSVRAVVKAVQRASGPNRTTKSEAKLELTRARFKSCLQALLVMGSSFEAGAWPCRPSNRNSYRVQLVVLHGNQGATRAGTTISREDSGGSRAL